MFSGIGIHVDGVYVDERETSFRAGNLVSYSLDRALVSAKIKAYRDGRGPGGIMEDPPEWTHHWEHDKAQTESNRQTEWLTAEGKEIAELEVGLEVDEVRRRAQNTPVFYDEQMCRDQVISYRALQCAKAALNQSRADEAARERAEEALMDLDEALGGIDFELSTVDNTERTNTFMFEWASWVNDNCLFFLHKGKRYTRSLWAQRLTMLLLMSLVCPLCQAAPRPKAPPVEPFQFGPLDATIVVSDTLSPEGVSFATTVVASGEPAPPETGGWMAISSALWAWLWAVLVSRIFLVVAMSAAGLLLAAFFGWGLYLVVSYVVRWVYLLVYGWNLSRKAMPETDYGTDLEVLYEGRTAYVVVPTALGPMKCKLQNNYIIPPEQKEAIMQGSIPRIAKLPACSFELVLRVAPPDGPRNLIKRMVYGRGEEFTHVGMAFKLNLEGRDFMVTALHCLQEAKTAITQGKALQLMLRRDDVVVGFDQMEPKMEVVASRPDVVMYTLHPSAWSMLAVKAAKLGKLAAGGNLVEISGPIASTSYKTEGRVVVDPRLPRKLLHTATTYPGWSGAPMVVPAANRQLLVVGVHLGYSGGEAYQNFGAKITILRHVVIGHIPVRKPGRESSTYYSEQFSEDERDDWDRITDAERRGREELKGTKWHDMLPDDIFIPTQYSDAEDDDDEPLHDRGAYGRNVDYEAKAEGKTEAKVELLKPVSVAPVLEAKVPALRSWVVTMDLEKVEVKTEAKPAIEVKESAGQGSPLVVVSTPVAKPVDFLQEPPKTLESSLSLKAPQPSEDSMKSLMSVKGASWADLSPMDQRLERLEKVLESAVEVLVKKQPSSERSEKPSKPTKSKKAAVPAKKQEPAVKLGDRSKKGNAICVSITPEGPVWRPLKEVLMKATQKRDDQSPRRSPRTANPPGEGEPNSNH
jgi:hypothetical protein